MNSFEEDYIKLSSEHKKEGRITDLTQEQIEYINRGLQEYEPTGLQIK